MYQIDICVGAFSKELKYKMEQILKWLNKVGMTINKSKFKLSCDIIFRI